MGMEKPVQFPNVDWAERRMRVLSKRFRNPTDEEIKRARKRLGLEVSDDK